MTSGGSSLSLPSLPILPVLGFCYSASLSNLYKQLSFATRRQKEGNGLKENKVKCLDLNIRCSYLSLQDNYNMQFHMVDRVNFSD
ncbi:hypothetical protein CIPAW_04G044400 [Carya illinoinensis]|uniref:Uncharacterized protein n=1 Tax=Carya illinoinensis TaxID=32201 RepID=A0A8T1QRZ6_CARIL|nr:hypothetical protein CIPAW_04G044400 [Carya illinoinensis]KAG6716345.1 hypothetical protein I3842_04G044500 [Carya illinoinensis]